MLSRSVFGEKAATNVVCNGSAKAISIDQHKALAWNAQNAWSAGLVAKTHPTEPSTERTRLREATDRAEWKVIQDRDTVTLTAIGNA